MSKAIDAKTTVKRFIGDAVCCLAIVVFALTLALPRYRDGMHLGDEGFLAYGAVRVSQGQVPNRDFVSLQPPLSFYIVAAVFKLFGTSVLSMRVLGVCIHTVIVLLVYVLARHLVGRLVALAAAVLAAMLGMPYFDFVPLAPWHGVVFTLAAALFFIRAVITARCRLAFAAGVATALVIISRHDQGFYLLVSVLVYALALKFAKPDTVGKPPMGRILGFWTAGVVALMLPLTIYWLICGAAGYMFQHLVLFPLTTYAKTSSHPMPPFNLNWPLHHIAVAALFYLAPVVGALVAVWVLVRVVRRRFYLIEARIVFILALSMLFYCQLLARSDVYHLLITLDPFFVLLVWSLAAVSRTAGNATAAISSWRYRRWASLAGSAGLWLIVAAAGGWFILRAGSIFVPSANKSLRAVSLERAGVRVAPEYAQTLEDINGAIQNCAAPDRSILCLPYQPMFYFLTDRRNPTRWNYLWPGDQTADDHRVLIEQARADPPAVVAIWKKADMQRYAPVILDYVDAEYRLAYDFGELKLYVPLKGER